MLILKHTIQNEKLLTATMNMTWELAAHGISHD